MMKIERASISTDGVAQPNPGQAGIGATIKNEQGELVASISEPIGYATNNQAEYRAIIAALETVIRLGVSRADIRSDSELVVRQINGRYRVKNAALKPLYQKVKQLQSRLKDFSITHVPREQNKEADKLAGKALR
ncbi:ribonuclease HI family protein [Chloroflexota bacterium]